MEVNPYKEKLPFDEIPKKLKDCFDCEGCLCEDLCKEYEEKPICPMCKSKMIDASNEVILNGFVCLQCGFIKADNSKKEGE